MPRKAKGRLYRRNKIYWLEYFVDGKRFQQSLKTTDAAEAERKRQRIVGPYHAREELDRRRAAAHAVEDAAQDVTTARKAARGRLLLVDVWAKYPYKQTTAKKGRRKTVRELSPTTQKDYEQQWEKLIEFMAEGHPSLEHMEDVTPEIADEYSRYLREEEGLSNNRHNKLVQTAGVMFRLAGRPDPFDEVQRYEVEYHSRTNLERDELKTVCQAAEGELRRLFAIGLYSGMRLKDCCLLEWDEHVKLRQRRLIRRTSKTGKVVSFPVHPELVAILKEVPAAERAGYVCPGMAERYERDKSSVSKAVTKHFGGLGLRTQETVKGLKRRVSKRGFHSFRHSFITECARADVPMGAIQKWIGHKSEDVTRIYEHWKKGQQEEQVIRALPSFAGDDEQKALPYPGDAKLIDLLQSMTARNWRSTRDKVLAVLQEGTGQRTNDTE